MTGRKLSITIALGPFYPTPPAPTGAVQRVWYDLSKRFAARGHQVTILACRHPGQAAEETVDGVRIRRRTSLNQGANIYRDILKDSWYSLRSFLLLPRADVLVTNAFWLPAVAPWLRPDAGRVYVCVQRVPKGQMRLYARAARLHAVSKAIADAIAAEVPVLAPKVKIIPNPVEVSVFTPPPPESRFAGADRRVVFTGRVHPEKGLHVLVRAVGLLRSRREGRGENIRLRLIGASRVDQGGGGPEYVDQLQRLAADLHVPLEISEPIFDRPALAAALQAADIYCYPSLAEKGEASPIAPVEAMATGLPPIVSDIPQFRDYVTPGQTGLVFDHRGGEDEAAERLAAAIASLLDDPAGAMRMGAAAHEHAQSLSYERIADAFLEDFASLSGGGRDAKVAGL